MGGNLKFPFYFHIPVVLLGTLIYSNTFHAPFELDDKYSIIQNYLIRHIDFHVFDSLPRRGLLYLSLALNYHFNQLNVVGYHLFNLAVHLMAAMAVSWLALLTFSTPVMKGQAIAKHARMIAGIAGLIFVAHPVQTEAVTYIVQRAASLAALFYLLSLCLYIKSRLSKNGGLCYAGALICALAAMFTKETAITLPLAILLYEYAFLTKKGKIDWPHLWPFLLTILVIPVTMALTEAGHERVQDLEAEPGISSWHYLLTQFRVIITYIRLLIVPIHQNLDYDYSVATTIFNAPVLASLACLALLFWTACRLWRDYRLIAFGLFWFFLTLLPESSILPIRDVIFEHRLYLPMAGYSLLLPAGAYYVFARRPKMAAAGLIVVIAIYAVLTYQRNQVWKDEASLWSDTIQKSPHKARPYNGRGNGLYNQGRYDQAVLDFDKAIELNPQYADAYFNRGIAYYHLGDLTQAGADFDKTIQLMPGSNSEAYNNRGLIYASQGQMSTAEADFLEAIKVDPFVPDAYCNLGNVYYIQKDYTRALLNYNKALVFDPSDAQALKNRDLAYGHLNH